MDSCAFDNRGSDFVHFKIPDVYSKSRSVAGAQTPTRYMHECMKMQGLSAVSAFAFTCMLGSVIFSASVGL